MASNVRIPISANRVKLPKLTNGIWPQQHQAINCISFAPKYAEVKTKGRRKDRINIVTLGCAKNLVDSEVMLTQLKGNKIDATHEKDEGANIAVINTCGFIENAKQESIDTSSHSFV